MGFSLSWLARVGSSRDETLALLKLEPTGRRDALASQPLQGLALRGGAYVVVARKCDHAIVSESSLAALSVAADVVACSIEEHVMVSRCEFWRGGRCLWRVAHDGQQSRRHLEADGELPPALAVARSDAQTQQDAEDAGAREVDFFFEVPLVLAQGIVGFKHDEPGENIDTDALETLVQLGTAPGRTDRKWWQIWR